MNFGEFRHVFSVLRGKRRSRITIARRWVAPAVEKIRRRIAFWPAATNNCHDYKPSYRDWLMIAPIETPPRFRSGQLVKHRRYGYRGVVVEYDPFCKAPEHWYQANQTQPDQNQPWYHVLVHGTTTVTYAAQTSLLPDDSGQPVDHPLVDKFFTAFEGDGYDRNDVSWGF
jgi:heat shock protein HspQ